MLRTLLAPRWLALHALTVAVVAAMLWLGWWQYGAAEERRERDSRQSVAAVPLEELAPPGGALPAEAVDRRVVVRGTWTGEQSVVPGRVLEQTMGAHVVAAVRVDGGATLAVLRGWVPSDTAVAPPRGPVEMVGTLRPYETPRDATLDPATDFAPGELPFLGAAEVEGALGLDGSAYAGVVALETAEPTPADAPEPVPLDVLAPQVGVGTWQHLSYWAQWWVFALGAVGFWVYQVRGAVRGRPEDADAPQTV